MKKHRGGPSLPAGRRLFEEGRIRGTGRLRRPSKPTYQDDSLGARTEKGVFKLDGGGGRGECCIIRDTKALTKTTVLPLLELEQLG